MTWEEFMERAASLGVDGVMILEFTEAEKRSHERVKALRSKADELNLFIETGTDGTDPEQVANDLYFSQEIGSEVMRITIESNRHSKAVSLGEQLKAAAMRLRRVVPLAKSLGIRLAIENHQDLTAPELVSVLERVDVEHVGICLDTGNSLALLEDPILTAEILAPYTFTTHFKDCAFTSSPYGTKISHTGLGRGLLPLVRIFEIIKKQAHDPNVNIEVVSEPGFTEGESLARENQIVADSVRYARNVLGL
jgi:sugar phosphate isomerase/epimerase